MFVDPLPLLRRLVAANSINPSLVPGAPGEADAADVAAAGMREAGLDVTVQEAAPGRPNVIGVLDGREPGPSVMFCGHIDTVGVEGMTAPFDPRESGGRLYGRGAQDMKSGVAAMIAAAGVAGEGLDPRPAHRRRRRRRRAHEPRRRGARARVARGHGDRHRADRSADGDRPQGLRLDRDRDERTRRARQPARGRPRRHRADGTRARRARSARSRAARAAAGARSRAPARCTRRSSPAAGSSAAIRIAACCRWNAGRSPARTIAPCHRRSTRLLSDLRRADRGVRRRGAGDGLPPGVPPRRVAPDRARARRRADERQARSGADRHVVLDRRRDPRRRRHSRRCSSAPAAPASTASRST